MSYTKVHESWEDLPSQATPIDAASLEQIEQGIADASDEADAAATAASSADASITNHLADTTDAHDASAISIADAGALFTADNVEAALAELHADIQSGGYQPGGTDVAVADGGTGASTASDARTNLGLGSMAEQDNNAVNITGGNIVGITDLTVEDGGTGASTKSGARDNLGIAVQATEPASPATNDLWVDTS